MAISGFSSHRIVSVYIIDFFSLPIRPRVNFYLPEEFLKRLKMSETTYQMINIRMETINQIARKEDREKHLFSSI